MITEEKSEEIRPEEERNDARSLLERLYHEIGVSAVAEALVRTRAR